MGSPQQPSSVQSQKQTRNDDLASEPTEENSTTTKLSKDEKPVVDKKDLDPNVYMQRERTKLLQVRILCYKYFRNSKIVLLKRKFSKRKRRNSEKMPNMEQIVTEVQDIGVSLRTNPNGK